MNQRPRGTRQAQPEQVIDLTGGDEVVSAAAGWLAAVASGHVPAASPLLATLRGPEQLEALSAVRAKALASAGLGGPEGDRLWDRLVWFLATASEAALRDELEELVRTDALTGLLNRRGLTEVLERELARARRTSSPLALVLIDVDHFKAVNDTLGHAAGDAALQAVAALLREGLRAGDVAGRWGGDEFAVVLSGVGGARARDVVDRLRSAFTHPARRNHLPGVVSFSAGVAELAGDDDPSSLLRRADDALYEAKSAGGNRAVLTGPGGSART